MTVDRLSRSAAGSRTPRAVVLLGVAIVSLVGCSADGRSGTDSVVAIEQAQADAAAEVAEAQAAIDRQVAAADALKAAADEAAAQAAAEAAAQKAAADRAAAAKAVADRAAAAKPTAVKPVAARPAVAKPAAAKPGAVKPAAVGLAAKPAAAKPPAAKPAAAKPAGRKDDPRATPRGKVVTPAPAQRAAAARPPRAAAVPQPAMPKPRPAATKPTGRPSGALSFTNDLQVVVAPGGTVTVPGEASVAAGCQPQDFSAGDRVLLTTDTGALVHETTLPVCQRHVVSAPGTGVAVTSPRFSLTLPKIAWRDGDAFVLQVGAHHWPVTASTLAQHRWSIAVTAQEGVTAGPVG